MFGLTTLLLASLSLVDAAHAPRRHGRISRSRDTNQERSPVVRGLPGSVSGSSATWYSLVPEEGGYDTHCPGRRPNANEYFVAMNTPMFDLSQCNSWITITYEGKTATAEILDSCPSCHDYGQLDMSEGLMRFFDPGMQKGVLRGVSWTTGGGGGEAPPPEEPKTTPTPEPTPEWTPEPTTEPSPTPTPTPEPTTEAPPSTTETPTSTSTEPPSSSSAAPSSSVPPSSSSVLPSSSSLLPSLNTTTVASTMAANSSNSSTSSQLPPSTTLAHPTAAETSVNVGSVPVDGNLGNLSGLIATFGRMLIVAAQ